MVSLRLNRLCKAFEGRRVVDAIDLEIASGELAVLVGPSGCGKSTLLRLVAGLSQVDSGQIFLGDEDVTAIPPQQRNVAMVFQNYALYPHLTVYENIAFPLRVRRTPKPELERSVHEVAETLGLTSELTKMPGELSGGQRQRVAMGRALTRKPKLFLFDEPLSNLDAALRTRMRAEIADLHRRLGVTMLYVTHDQHEAMTLGDRLVLLNEGKIEQMGPPRQVYAAPETRFAGAFLGSPPMNFVEGIVKDGKLMTADGVGCELREAPPGPGAWGFRPEVCALVEPGAEAIEAHVEWREHTGSDDYVYLRVGTQSIVARLQGGVVPDRGAKVFVKPRQWVWFDAQGAATTRWTDGQC